MRKVDAYTAFSCRETRLGQPSTVHTTGCIAIKPPLNERLLEQVFLDADPMCKS